MKKLARMANVKKTMVVLGSLGLFGCGSASGDDVEKVRLALTPSSAQLAECMPEATLDVTVELRTENVGFDRFKIRAHNLPPRRDFAVFLIEQAGAPFGAAEYIGDFSTNENGDADNTFALIVQEAFASTIVNGQRVRADLNEVGVWFADPAADDFCLGAGAGAVTPFDGDNEAGVQVFNSANADPLPAP
ncbi:MAG: hypothetical protein ABI624_14305 [Casimicrobiaceae bacterium]